MRALLLSAVILASACNNAPPPKPPPPAGHIELTDNVVMTVNGNKVTEEMVGAVTRRIPPEQLEQMKASGRYSEFEERMAVGQVLYTRAIEKGLHEDPEIKLALAMSQRDVLAAELLDSVSKEAVSDEKLREAYDKRAVQYKRPQVQARHILVKEKSLADELVGKLASGGDFAALAKEHSTDPGSGAKGGDLGWFEKGRMVKPFSDAAFDAELNTVIGPVESRYGFHIIEVQGKRDGIPFEDVKDQLEKQVKQQSVTEYLDAIKAEMTVEKPGETAGGDAGTAADGADTPTPPAPAPEGHGKDDGHGHGH